MEISEKSKIIKTVVESIARRYINYRVLLGTCPNTSIAMERGKAQVLPFIQDAIYEVLILLQEEKER